MDTVYGTKKYFQSLSGANDLYRSQGIRAVSNDYIYQNTLGRRSTLGAYYHMNKQPSYANDLSYNSQYNYNTWGIWRDGRNIAPSTFSAKTHHSQYQKTRSFSIIFTTAAFIVLLAVISIAGLAFYFSSIKTTMENPVLGFEGSFRIAKGDLYSTGLKYNHTTTYKQKIEFYRRFVERALTDNNLQPLRTDVWGFGDGPLIKVNFRVFLDVRKLPENIHNVEEFIKESLFSETTALKSLYRSLRLDAESVEIKRVLDEQVVKSASLFKEAQSAPTSQTQLEKRLLNKNGPKPGLISKTTTTQKPRNTARPHSADDEPDVDVENAPIIQGSFEGSFEITKTDADIARKKTSPTKAYSSSLPPKAITPFPLRVKPKKPLIEKLTTIIPQHQTNSQPSTTTTTAKTTTTTSTTTNEPSTTKMIPTTTTTTQATMPTSSTSPTTITLTTPYPTMGNQMFPHQFTYPTIAPPSSPPSLVPKLDSNLFTSIPVLDTQPWRPIHREVPEFLPGPPPAFPTKTIPFAKETNIGQQQPFAPDIPIRRMDEVELPFLPDEPAPPTSPMKASFDTYTPDFFGTAFRKPDLSSDSYNAQDMMFYHSFSNPVFMPGAEGIERLGSNSNVQPHPLPVPLIDDVVPPFRPIRPTLDTNEKLAFDIEAVGDKFEHLGDGVIVKKTEKPPTKAETDTTLTKIESPSAINNGLSSTTTNPTKASELADTLGALFMDLLNISQEGDNFPKDRQELKNNTIATTTIQPLESRIEADEDENVAEKTEIITQKTDQVIEDTTTTTTKKPTFLNLKEIILRRNQVSNQTRKYSSATTPRPKQSITTTVTAASNTTKRRQPPTFHGKPPTILDDSNLFPSHSKWEFVNSSATQNYGHPGNMRKVFNKTLQAWVSEDIDQTENFTIHDIRTRINNSSNIQDISLIFDTLASKLGITPSVPAKVPPFSNNKLNKLNNSHKDDYNATPRYPTTTTTIEVPTSSSTADIIPTTTTANPSLITTQTTKSTVETDFIELPMERHETFTKPMSNLMDSSSEGFGAGIPVVGEAEVEVIDPNKYEEMLRSSQFAESTTETSPKLVTLLPVRSNSGIRIFKTEEEMQRSNDAAIAEVVKPPTVASSDEIITQKNSISQSRRFPPAEAIVKGGLSVTI